MRSAYKSATGAMWTEKILLYKKDRMLRRHCRASGTSAASCVATPLRSFKHYRIGLMAW